MHKRGGLSATHEMYLKIIYQLRASGDPARVGQMAKGLGVHPSTVSAVVRTLEKMDLVTHDRYGVVKLTSLGERLAGCVARRFEVLREFFMNVLGLDQETAEIEACETEHALSPDTIGRLEHLAAQLAKMDFKPPVDYVPPDDAECYECIEAGTCRAAQAVPLKQSTPARE
ncbi:MAG: metal-dependent transcriptional regulator [Planctomycetes bacterium]|nr:metal-dependent transcriptional regulator [Planctomycetota bacterium]